MAAHHATFPREDVIAEADALLYNVLRWPVADTSPDWEHAITASSFAAGPVTNFTREQAQITDGIAALMHEGTTPTRVLVRTRALEKARVAMRPGDGASPIVHAIVRLDRMDATPPPTGLIRDRITYLERAAALMGTAAREHARVVPIRDRWTPPFPSTSPTTLAPARRAIGLVS